MKVLIIGGNRFVGKKLVRFFMNDGHDVVVFNRGSVQDKSVYTVFGDRKKAEDLEQLNKYKFDIVYDFVCFEYQDAVLAQNFFSNRVDQYIVISSQSVYHQNGELVETDFNSSVANLSKFVKVNEDYALAKQQVENVFYTQNNFSSIQIRFPFILGADDYSKRLQWHVDRVRLDQDIYFPNPEAKISMISSDAAASALYFLSQHQITGPLNVASFEPIKLTYMISLIEKKYSVKARFSQTEEKDNHSPYGVKQDWWMNCRRLCELGFEPEPIEKWIYDLI